jgi:hypothetical protein
MLVASSVRSYRKKSDRLQRLSMGEARARLYGGENRRGRQAFTTGASIMRSGHRPWLGTAGAALAAILASSSVAADSHRSSYAKLVGTWRVEIATYNCTTGVESPAFKSLLTFGPGGTLAETTGNPVFLPGQRGPAQGSWRSTGPGSYYAAMEAFIQFDSEPRGPIPAFRRGSQRIEQTITFTAKNRFASQAFVYFFDAGGTPLVAGCARATGERFK